jgi:hypothetical protein
VSVTPVRILSLCENVYVSRTNRQKFLLDKCGTNNVIDNQIAKKLKTILSKHIGKTYTKKQIGSLKVTVFDSFNINTKNKDNSEQNKQIIKFVNKFLQNNTIDFNMDGVPNTPLNEKVQVGDSDRVYQSLPDAANYLTGPSFVDIKLLNKTISKAGKLGKFSDSTFGTETREYFEAPEWLEKIDLALVTTRLAYSSAQLNSLKRKRNALDEKLEKLKSGLETKIGTFSGVTGGDDFLSFLEEIFALKHHEHERSVQLSDTINQYLKRHAKDFLKKDRKVVKPELVLNKTEKQELSSILDLITELKDCRREYLEINNEEKLHKALLKEFKHEAMIEVFQNSVKGVSETFSKLGESSGVVLIKVAGKVVPVLNLALTGYKIVEKNKSLNAQCKTMKRLSTVLSDENLNQLYSDDNNEVKKELKAFREATLKKRTYKATKDKLSLTCSCLGALATASGIVLKTLQVIGIAIGVGLSVVTAVGAVLSVVAVLMVIHYYSNRHNRNTLILNIKSVYRNINLLVQSRKVKKARDAFDEVAVNMDQKKIGLVVQRGLEYQHQLDKYNTMVALSHKLAYQIKKEGIYANKVRHKRFKTLRQALKPKKQGHNDVAYINNMNALSNHFKTHEILNKEKEDVVFSVYDSPEVLKGKRNRLLIALSA